MLLNSSDIKRTSRRTVLLKGSDIKRTSRRTVLLKGSDIKRTSRRTALLKGSDIKRTSRRTVLLKGSDIKRTSRRTALLKGSDIKRASRRTVLLNGRNTRTIQLPLRHLKGIGIGMTPLSDWLNVLPRGSGIAGVTERTTTTTQRYPYENFFPRLAKICSKFLRDKCSIFSRALLNMLILLNCRHITVLTCAG